MAKTKSNEQTTKQEQPNTAICDCTDCLWAHLIQYDAPRDPLLAECTRKPQPYSVHFPFVVEVARAKKLCPMYRHTDEVRIPELRPKRRFYAMAANVKPELRQAV